MISASSDSASRTIVVTGANGQLGRVVVATLQQHDWHVVGLDREHGDLSDPAQVSAAFATLSSAPPLWGVVHLVGGIVAGKGLDEHTDNDVDTMIALNLRTTVAVMRAALPLLRAHGGGSIITIGAQCVAHPVAGRALYAATKAAVVALTSAVAEEGRAHNIRANCLLPSIINTEANRAWGSAEEIAAWITPEAMANTICDLLSPTNGVNGAVLPMYGRLPS